MRRKVFLPVLLVVLFVFPVMALAGTEPVSPFYQVGVSAGELALKELGVEKGDSDLLAMTDAGYAMPGGKTTEGAVDGIMAATGCTIGKGNLLMIQRNKYKPLWFAFYNKKTGDLLYLQIDKSVAGKTAADVKVMGDKDLFAYNVKENISFDNLSKHAKAWEGKMSNKIFCGNEYSLMGIATLWAHPNCTYDFLQTVSFHNHMCPGVTSGFLIVKYLDKHLPLGPGQSYKIIACPNWCKDDAFQILLDTTPGKRGLTVMNLTDEQKKQLPTEAQNVAGIYIRWDDQAKKGDALVLTYSFDQASKLAGVTAAGEPGWLKKLRTNVGLLDSLDRYEEAITVLKRFTVSESDLAELQSAGVNPLVMAGVLKE